MKQKTFYIYEILGKKIGCTTCPRRRVQKEQGCSDYRILAEFHCIYMASFMERFLQEQNGYKVDTTPYYITYENRVRVAKRGQESQRKNKTAFYDKEVVKRVAVLGGKVRANSKEGKEQMSALGKTYGKIYGKTRGIDNFIKANERRKENGELERSGRQLGLRTGGITWKRLNQEKWKCEDGHITSRGNVKKYSLKRGLDPALAVKIENNQ